MTYAVPASSEGWWANRPPRLSASVLHELSARIVRGTIPQGSVLPPEAALCAEFKVSRGVLREALKALEKNRLVQIRQGDGTTVCAESEWNLLDPEILALVIHSSEDGTAIRAEIRDLRSTLEARMTRRAAGKLLEADFERMSYLASQMDTLLSPELLYQADVEFHDVILAASGDRVSHRLVRLLFSQPGMQTRTGAEPGRAEYDIANDEHKQIARLLAMGDGEGAADAMANHILGGHWLDQPKR